MPVLLLVVVVKKRKRKRENSINDTEEEYQKDKGIVRCQIEKSIVKRKHSFPTAMPIASRYAIEKSLKKYS